MLAMNTALAVLQLLSSGTATAAAAAAPTHCRAQTTFGCFQEVECGADVHTRCVSGTMIKGRGVASSPEACACACHAARPPAGTEAPFTLAGIEMGACFCDHGAAPNATRCHPLPARPSLIPSLCTHFTRAEIEWRR